MNKRRILTAATAVLMIAAGTLVMAPVASAVDSTLSVTVTDSDPVSDISGLCGDRGDFYYVVRTVTVSETGTYEAVDDYVGNLDGCLYVYELGGFNPLIPADNIVGYVDDTESLDLDAGEYTVVFAPYQSLYTGTVSYTLSGPGTWTLGGDSAPTPDQPRQIWFQSVARTSADATCEVGYTPSWDIWPNGGNGGWVCNRQIFAYGQ